MNDISDIIDEYEKYKSVGINLKYCTTMVEDVINIISDDDNYRELLNKCKKRNIIILDYINHSMSKEDVIFFFEQLKNERRLRNAR